MPKALTHPVVIIGSGPAGLTAAIYTARAELKPLVIDGPNPGGQPMGTSVIENWPGEKNISGPDLSKKMREHAKHCGTLFLADNVTEVDFSTHPFQLWTKKKTKIVAKTVIIATGATPIKLNCPGEKEFWGKGVGSCAICDGALYKNKSVVVVGGGDSAATNALFLTHFTKNITMIQHGEKLTAKPKLTKQVKNHKNINVLYSNSVTEIKGNKNNLTHVVIQNQNTGEKKELDTNGVFLAIGLRPSTSVFADQLELDQRGYIKVKNGTQTAIKGIFAAGDVADNKYRQAITASGTGCMAALDAEHFLEDLKKNPY